MTKILFKPFLTHIASTFILLAFSGSIFAACTKAEVETADKCWANAIDSNNANKAVNLYIESK